MPAPRPPPGGAAPAPSRQTRPPPLPPRRRSAGRGGRRGRGPASSDNARQVAVAAREWSATTGRAGLPGWTLHFADGRSGYRGMTFIERRAIEVYVRPGDTPERVAEILAHEIGHAVDLTHLYDRGRPVAGCTWPARLDPLVPRHVGRADFATGAGDFAESFAWCRPAGALVRGLASPPTFAQGPCWRRSSAGRDATRGRSLLRGPR